MTELPLGTLRLATLTFYMNFKSSLTYSSSFLTPSLAGLTQHYGVSSEATIVGLSLFVLGECKSNNSCILHVALTITTMRHVSECFAIPCLRLQASVLGHSCLDRLQTWLDEDSFTSSRMHVSQPSHGE